MTVFKDKSMPTHICKHMQAHTYLYRDTYVQTHTCYLCKQMDQIQLLFTPVHSCWTHTHTLKLSPLQCCGENSHFKTTVVLLLQLRLGQLKDLQFSKQSNALQAHVFRRQARSGPDTPSSQSYTQLLMLSEYRPGIYLSSQKNSYISTLSCSPLANSEYSNTDCFSSQQLVNRYC